LSQGKNVLKKIMVGDVVARLSYDCDMLFKVVRIYTDEDGKEYAWLKGLDIRLEANAPLDDLLEVDPRTVSNYRQQCECKHMEKVVNVLRRRDNDYKINFKRAMGNPIND